jgi:hypothetical protein
MLDIFGIIRRFATLALLGCALLLATASLGPPTEDCQALCDDGNREACDRRSELESKLSTLCNVRSNMAACEALCHGRLNQQGACQKLGAAH